MVMMKLLVAMISILSRRPECFVSKSVIDVLMGVGEMDILDLVGLFVAAVKISPKLSA